MAAVNINYSVAWNQAASCWVIDISDSSGNPLVQGIPLVCGADLLGQYGYLGLGGELIVQTDNSPDTPPTFTNLGASGHLYFFSTPTT